MSIFNVSGDWENNDVGEELCKYFQKDDKSEHVMKRKRKKKDRELIKSNLVSSANLILKSKKLLIKKFKTDTDHVQKDTLLLDTPLKPGKSSKKKSKTINKIMPLVKNGILSKKRKKISDSTDHKNLQNKLLDKLNIKSKEKKNDIIKKHKKKKAKSTNGDSPSFTILKPSEDATPIDKHQLSKRRKQLQKLKQMVEEKDKKQSSQLQKQKPILTLRQKMMKRLKAARFRFLNEQIYTTTSAEAEKIFKTDPESFKAYHEGYRQQVQQWPINPLDVVIHSISKMPKTNVIADFGCGEARLAQTVKQVVHSFDFVPLNSSVIPCDMAHVPLEDSSVDVAVFCLSLMGTNLQDYLLEANRVLKKSGILKIAEVESRFEDVNMFIKACEQFGFKKVWMDLSHELFYFIDFRKENSLKGKKKLPKVTLQPCLYKKR